MDKFYVEEVKWSDGKVQYRICLEGSPDDFCDGSSVGMSMSKKEAIAICKKMNAPKPSVESKTKIYP